VLENHDHDTIIILISIVVVKVTGSVVIKQKSIDYVYLSVCRLFLSLRNSNRDKSKY